MTEVQKKYLLRTALFAILYDGILMWIGCLLIHPATMGSIHTFKATVTIGLPSIQQLLDVRHQVGTLTSGGAGAGFMTLWFSFSTVLYVSANGYFISLLARSVRDLPGRASLAATRAFWPLFFWMLVQLLLSLLLAPLMAAGQMIGGALATLLLLGFRFYFLFMEYTIVTHGCSLRVAWRLSVQIRQTLGSKSWAYYLGVMLFNVGMAYLINLLFSLPVLALCMLVNSFAMTWVQQWQMRHFFTASDDVLASR